MPHRTVRFQLDDTADDDWRRESVDVEDRGWVEQEDFMHSDDDNDDGHGEDPGRSRAPLLTGIQAPTVTVAMSTATEELLDGDRPKSGMGMAFFNMS